MTFGMFLSIIRDLEWRFGRRNGITFKRPETHVDSCASAILGWNKIRRSPHMCRDVALHLYVVHRPLTERKRA